MTEKQQNGFKSVSQKTKSRITIHDLTFDSDEEPSLTIPTRRSENTSIKTRRATKQSTSGTSLKSNTRKRSDKEEDENGSTKIDTSKAKNTSKLKLPRSKKPKATIGDIFGSTSVLDQTADFSGGFTPYKALAEKRLTRVKSQHEASSTSLKTSKKNDHQSAKQTLKHDKENLEKCSKPASREKELVHDSEGKSTLGETIRNQIYKGKDDDLDDKQCNPETNEKHEDKSCNICGVELQKGDIDHIKQCLQSKFTFKSGTSAASGTKSNVEKQNLIAKKIGGLDFVFCQVCQEDITPLTADERTTHVNACIDGVPVCEPSDSGEMTTCHICHRDLSELNSHRRLQHVNFCVDRNEKEKKEQELALKQAKAKVLDCPLCGKPLQTQASRRNHLKQCSRVLGVSPSLLQERVKQQEDEYQLQLAAGVLPPQNRTTRPRNTRRRRQGDTTSERTAPVRHLDADTQLALALSTSLAEHKKVEAAAGAPPGGPEPYPGAKDAFQILMTPKAVKTKKGRKNKGPERVPELLLQSREDIQKHLAARLEILFSQESGAEVTSTPPLKDTEVLGKRSSRVLKNINYKVAEEAPIWTLTKLLSKHREDQYGGGDIDKENGPEIFYVQQIMPPVTVSLPCLKPKVHRRIDTPENTEPGHQSVFGSQGKSQVDAASKRASCSNETLVATTQTAVYLAELADEAGDPTLNSTSLGVTMLDHRRQSMAPSSSQTGPSEHERTGFSVESEKKEGKEYDSLQRNCIINQLRTMINNPIMSDLQIKTKDGPVFAHKFMFAARYPHLLKDIGSSSTVNLSEYDTQTVKEVLTFIYTGYAKQITPEVAKVAARWNLIDLLKLCKGEVTYPEEITSLDTTQAKLDEMLKNIWGSDYEESDSEDESNDIVEPNDENMEEACNFVLTQRRRSENQEHTTESSSSESESSEGTKGPFDKFNMTAVDILSQLAKMNEDSVDSDDEGVLAVPVSESESSSLEDPYLKLDSNSKDLEYVNQKGRVSDTMDMQFNQEFDICADIESNEQEMKKVKYAECSEAAGEETSKGQEQNVDSCDELHHISQNVDPQKQNRESVYENFNSSKYETTSESAVRSHLGPEKADEAANNESTEDFNLTYSPATIDGGSDMEVQIEICKPTTTITGENREPKHENIQLYQNARCLSLSLKDDSDIENDGALTPELFAGSPQTPLPLDNSAVNESLLEDPNKTGKSNVSDVDLFEVENNSSNGGETPKITLSPVFRKGKSSEALRELNSAMHNQNQSDSGINDEDLSDGPIETSLNKSTFAIKRKRSPSISSEDEDTLSQSKKRSRIGSSSDQGRNSPVYERFDPSQPAMPGVVNPSASQCSQSFCPTAILNGEDNSVKKKEEEVQGHFSISSDSDIETAEISDFDINDKVEVELADNQPRSTHNLDNVSTSDADPAADTNKSDDDPIDLTQGDDVLGDDNVEITGSDYGAEDPPECSPVRRARADHDISQSDSPLPMNSPEAPDTWSDFDDAGYTEDFMMPTTQHVQKPASPSSPVPEPSTSLPQVAFSPDTSLEYDPPTDMETDISMMDEDHANIDKDKTPAMKTPKPPRPTRRRMPAVPASPFTPMADYDSMVTPDIKKACQNIGVRPMPKKRMITLLKSIYQNTHQYESDSELEQSFETAEPSCSRNSRNQGTTNNDKSIKSTANVKARRGARTAAVQRSQPVMSSKPSAQLSANMSDDDSDEDRSPLSSLNMNPVGGDLPEESFLGSQAEPAVPTERTTADKQSTVDVKREKIQSYIQSNDELYLKILHFKPLEFDEFRQQLKDNGVKAGSDIIMDFLDDQNIQFTLRKRKDEKEARREEKASQRGSGQGSGRGRGRGRRMASSQVQSTSAS